jgi:actin-like ATPase involved in cell morphogenesis/tetratricopeptide (TPR) repeat protein
MSSTDTIAIDFGTTRTKAAYFNENSGKPELIRLGRRSDFIPSIFHLSRVGDRDRILVGDDAEQAGMADPAGLLIGLKTEMHNTRSVRIGMLEKRPSRQDLLVLLLKQVRSVASRTQRFREAPPQGCVITVPVRYGEAERETILGAAKRAGFSQVAVMEEPVAAATAWLRGLKSAQGEVHHAIVCDIGGGTTDYAVLKRDGDEFLEDDKVPPGGDRDLGGNKLDRDIADEFMNRPDALEKLQNVPFAAVQREIQMWRENIDTCDDQIDINFRDASIRLEKLFIAKLSDEFVSQILKHFQGFLDSCNDEGIPESAPIIMIGGGSRIPTLTNRLRTLTPRTVFEWENCDVAGVLGAVPVPANSAKVSHSKEQAYARYAESCEAAIADGHITTPELDMLQERASNFGISTDEAMEIFEHVKRDYANRTGVEVQDGPPRRMVPESQQQKAAHLVAKAEAAFLQNDINEAIQLIQSSLLENPSDEQARIDQIEFYRYQRNFQKAHDAAENWLNLDPDNAEAILYMGEACFWLKNFTNACDCYVRVFNDANQILSEEGDKARLSLHFNLYAGACLRSGDSKAYSAALDGNMSRLLQALPACQVYPPRRNKKKLTAVVSNPLLQYLAVLNLDCAKPSGKSDPVRINEAALFARELRSLKEKHKNETLAALSAHIDLACDPDTAFSVEVFSRIAKGSSATGHELLPRSSVSEFCDLFSGDVGSGFLDIMKTQNDLKTLVLFASVFAERRQFDLTERVLDQIFGIAPGFDAHLIHSDKFIQAGSSTKQLKQYFDAKIIIEESHGALFNHVAVTNMSIFEITDLHLNISVKRAPQQGLGPKDDLIRRSANRIAAGAKYKWDNVFPDAGFLGGNINSVRVTVASYRQDPKRKMTLTDSSERAPSLEKVSKLFDSVNSDIKRNSGVWKRASCSVCNTPLTAAARGTQCLSCLYVDSLSQGVHQKNPAKPPSTNVAIQTR